MASQEVGHMRVTLKAINDELARRGATPCLAKAAGYFYFQFGEPAEWLDRTVRVSTVGSLTPGTMAQRTCPAEEAEPGDHRTASGWQPNPGAVARRSLCFFVWTKACVVIHEPAKMMAAI